MLYIEIFYKCQVENVLQSSYRNMYMYYVPCDLEDMCVDLSRKSNNLILSSKNMKIPDVKKLCKNLHSTKIKKKNSLDKTFPNCLKKNPQENVNETQC